MKKASCGSSLLFILFLFPVFSFPQSYPSFDIKNDSLVNPRFVRINRVICASLLSRDSKAPKLKSYTENLRPATGEDILRHFLDTEEVFNDIGIAEKKIGFMAADDIYQYVLRNESGKYYISSFTGKGNLWLSLNEMNTVLPDSDAAFLQDLFINRHTKVLYRVLRPCTVNSNFDNSMMSLWNAMKLFMQAGELTAFKDPLFDSAMSAPERENRMVETDTSYVPKIDYPDENNIIIMQNEVVPERFSYLFEGEMTGNALKPEGEKLVALAPYAERRPGTGHQGEMLWLKYSELSRLLRQYEKDILWANYRGQYNDFIVDRFSTSYCVPQNAQDSLFISRLTDELKNKLMEGSLSAYSQKDFSVMMTPSEVKNSLFVYNEAESDTGVVQIAIALNFNCPGLLKYHYRASDHRFENYAMNIGLTVARFDEYKEAVIPAFYLYLPELKYALRKTEYDSLMNFFDRNILVSAGDYTVIEDGDDGIFYLQDDKGRKVYAGNLPQYGFNKNEKIKISFENLENNIDTAGPGRSVYINSILTVDNSGNAAGNYKLIPYIAPCGAPVRPFTGSVSGGSVLALPTPCVIVSHAGYCDENGTVRIPLKYDESELFSEGRGLVYNYSWENTNRIVKRVKHCGYIDPTGTEVIPLEYEDARSFSDELASVKKDGKWGYINKDGSTHYAFVFDNAWSFAEGRAIIKMDKKFGVLGPVSKKSLCEMTYDSICTFHEGWARVLRDGRWGFIDAKGREKIPAIYLSVEDFNNGIAKCVDAGGHNHYFNHKGKELFIETGADKIKTASGKVAVMKENEKFSIVDLKGKKIAGLDCDSVSFFSEGLMAVRKGLNHWAFVNESGMEVISPKPGLPAMAPTFHDSVCIFIKDENHAFVMDRNGKIVYDSIALQENRHLYFENGYLRLNNNGCEYYIDRTGREYMYH